ncbi:hypothetical protein D3C81_1682320 [compost metagenome]
MPQVRIAARAEHLDAVHAVAEILHPTQCLGGNRLEIARPATAGVVLGIRVEQRRIAAGTVVDARSLAVVVLAGEGALGPLETADLELAFRQLLAPLIQRLFDLLHVKHLALEKSPPLPFHRARGSRMMRGFQSVTRF